MVHTVDVGNVSVVIETVNSGPSYVQQLVHATPFTFTSVGGGCNTRRIVYGRDDGNSLYLESLGKDTVLGHRIINWGRQSYVPFDETVKVRDVSVDVKVAVVVANAPVR